MAKGNPTETGHVRSSSMHTPYKTTNHGVGNPYNEFQADSAGVLGPGIKGQNAGRNTDSPVQTGAPMPDTNQVTKQAEANSVPSGLPGEGVLGRG